MSVHQAKSGSKDTAALQMWLDRHGQAIQHAASSLSPFDIGWLRSRYYRVWAFLPQLRDQMFEMVEAMNEAERIAAALETETSEFELCARELMWPVLESRIKEAYARDCLDDAETYARRLVSLAKLESRAHLHLANLLVQRDRISEAKLHFRMAARLGPPATETALFFFGQCAEAEEDHEAAADAYIEVLRLDSLSDSALDRLKRVSANTPPDWLLQLGRHQSQRAA